MRLVSMLACLAACGGAGAPPPTTPVSNVAPRPSAPDSPIAGDYKTTHTVMVVCDSNADGWCEQPVDDRMTIREGADGKIAVVIEVVQTNAHSCTFENELVAAPSPGNGVRRWAFHDASDLGPCDLTLDRTDKEFKVDSEGCRYYCGARASLVATFAATP